MSKSYIGTSDLTNSEVALQPTSLPRRSMCLHFQTCCMQAYLHSLALDQPTQETKLFLTLVQLRTRMRGIYRKAATCLPRYLHTLTSALGPTVSAFRGTVKRIVGPRLDRLHLVQYVHQPCTLVFTDILHARLVKFDYSSSLIHLEETQAFLLDPAQPKTTRNADQVDCMFLLYCTS